MCQLYSGIPIPLLTQYLHLPSLTRISKVPVTSFSHLSPCSLLISTMKIICQSSSHLESESHIHPHEHHPFQSLMYLPPFLHSLFLHLTSLHLSTTFHIVVSQTSSCHKLVFSTIFTHRILSPSHFDFIKFSSHILVSKPHSIEDSEVIDVVVLSSTPFSFITTGNPGFYSVGKTSVCIHVNEGDKYVCTNCMCKII